MTQMKAMTFHTADAAHAVRLLSDDQWVAEQKIDGVRCMARVENGECTLLNRNGEPLTCASTNDARLSVMTSLEKTLTEGSWLLDGKILATGEYWVFDLVNVPGILDRSAPYDERRLHLECLAQLADWPNGIIQIVPVARGTQAKVALVEMIQDIGGEGVMLKSLTAPYVGGRARTGFKLKFTSTVDCFIVERNTDGHENAELAVVTDSGAVKRIGAMSMIGKPNLSIGTVVEVECLYVGDNWRLYQPRLKCVRKDKLMSECHYNQLPPLRTNRTVVTFPEDAE
jgi:ATP-dependent DNA ligase